MVLDEPGLSSTTKNVAPHRSVKPTCKMALTRPLVTHHITSEELKKEDFHPESNMTHNLLQRLQRLSTLMQSRRGTQCNIVSRPTHGGPERNICDLQACGAKDLKHIGHKQIRTQRQRNLAHHLQLTSADRLLHRWIAGGWNGSPVPQWFVNGHRSQRGQTIGASAHTYILFVGCRSLPSATRPASPKRRWLAGQ